MIKQEDPRKGDTVRVHTKAVAEGVVDEVHTERIDIDLPDGDRYSFDRGPTHTFEIIKRADDPSSDPVGTIRRHDNDVVYLVKRSRDRWVAIGECTVHSVDDAAAANSRAPIVGDIPGTPAARARDGHEFVTQTGKYVPPQPAPKELDDAVEVAVGRFVDGPDRIAIRNAAMTEAHNLGYDVFTGKKLASTDLGATACPEYTALGDAERIYCQMADGHQDAHHVRRSGRDVFW